ncbi:type III-A CRISPR-associated protein Csm2 [Methanobrevibacter filiformis]|uniref:CRISPR system Cms protein Csm2 n=1 Tax=Methanobrevibacter filiformis TaxID=55758 RepID=A0A166FFM9_9EURY|nr:type III-A CRISPR-associated protein Csm2 [Methanobrevibacter filiformis]KZX17626.1 hypothetical protein MBFIL_00360 [Methanobrevibacter filiformis]
MSKNIELKRIKDKIDNLDNFKDYSDEDFAKFGGDADSLTKNLGNKDIKTSQLRKFFAAVKEIEVETKEKGWSSEPKVHFYLLMPKIAYAKSRELISHDFYDLLKISMEKVVNGKDESSLEDFKKFTLFLESIVAFYKANKPRSS